MLKGNRIVSNVRQNSVFLAMLVPGILVLFFFSYLPMAGIFIAFKDINYAKGLLASDWIGFKNFEFFVKTPDIFNVTRNTLLYNGVFIVLGPILAVTFAVMLNELRNRLMSKVYQTVLFFPYFVSWVVVGYISFALFNSSYGAINRMVLEPLGLEGISWFSEPKYWPVIITIFHFWKSIGYSIVVYMASIAGIDSEMYEAAAIDGASKLRQVFHITIPCLKPIIIITSILNIGKIFHADFGLFYQTTMNSGALYETTNVLDTYVFRALRVSGDIGMASAAGLYQAVVGFILVLATNAIVRKLDPDNALF